MGNKINSRVIGFNRRQSYRVLSFVVAVAGFMPPSLAFAVPVATTEVAKLCEARAGAGDFDQEVNVARPFGQATACNVYDVGEYAGQPSIASGEGYASAGFGPGFPQIGMASASAQVTSVNDGIAEANLMGSVQYYFEIQPLQPAPVESPQGLPALFSVSGAGQISKDDNSLSRAQGIASLSGPIGNQAWFSFDLMSDPTTGGFNETASVNLYPNIYGDATYWVVLSAACSTWAYAYFADSSSATCSASVGPSFLGFDQAAFDAIMGADTFALNEYYQFVVSPNAVPVPAAVWLFGSGLLGLIGVARRKQEASEICGAPKGGSIRSDWRCKESRT